MLKAGKWPEAKEAFAKGLREVSGDDDRLSHSYGMMLLNEGGESRCLSTPTFCRP